MPTAQPFPEHRIIRVDPDPSRSDAGRLWQVLSTGVWTRKDEKAVPHPSPAAPHPVWDPMGSRSGSFLRDLASPSRQRGLSLPMPPPAKLATRPGAAFAFLPRAHSSAELSAAPVIGPRRSPVLGVNTAESEKTRAEPSPGASGEAAKPQRAGGAARCPGSPSPPAPNPEKPAGRMLCGGAPRRRGGTGTRSAAAGRKRWGAGAEK